VSVTLKGEWGFPEKRMGMWIGVQTRGEGPGGGGRLGSIRRENVSGGQKRGTLPGGVTEGLCGDEVRSEETRAKRKTRTTTKSKVSSSPTWGALRPGRHKKGGTEGNLNQST